MNNDLISRSALITAIQDHFDNLDVYFPSAFIKEVEEAPTVEAVPLEHHKKIKGMLQHEVETLVDILDKERPKGEWIFLKANTDGYGCSVCKATFHTKVPYFSEFNFCPSCGADMRKEGEP